MTTTETLTIHQFKDLVAAPSLLLGFHPQDSCVVMAARTDGSGRREVLFCARVDLDWYLTCFDQVVEQLLAVEAQVGFCEWILVGYAASEDDAVLCMEELQEVLGMETVMECLVCDGKKYWPLGMAGQALDYCFESSALAAQAVYKGISIARTRHATVAQVESGVVCPKRWEEAVSFVEELPLDAKLAELQRLIGEPRPGESAATRIAALLRDEDCFAAVLVELSTSNAEQHFDPLARARRACPEDAVANVLALLALTCWLAGRAAQHTSCLEQLARLAPEHPLLGVLLRMHRHAIPPKRWDET